MQNELISKDDTWPQADEAMEGLKVNLNRSELSNEVFLYIHGIVVL